MGFLVDAVSSVVNAVVGVVKAVVHVVAKVVGAVFGFIVGHKHSKASTNNILNKTLDPEAFRKIVLGKTAAPLDVRYWETYANNTKYDEILVLATHQINSILEIYFDDALGLDSLGNVQSAYSGLVTRTKNLGTIGQTALSAGAGSLWTSTSTFDGCPHIKLAWVPDDKKLPNGIPSRYTQVVEGALVYDPRRDSTVTGGSGTHRSNDQTTWAYATLDSNGIPIGRNNALQALWYLLGWTIPTKDASGTVTGSMLVCGRGVNAADIDMSSFITGANACEAAQYYTDMTLTTQDDHTTNEDKITCNGLIGRLIDPGGLWSYYANVDTTGSVAVSLTDADIVEGSQVTWNEYKGMSDQYSQVGGNFINPSPSVLYQNFAYPLVRDATYEANLGVKKRLTLDFDQVISNSFAQKLARLNLNEYQYQGEFAAVFMPRAMKAQAWSIVSYQSDRFGWTKLFRVWRHEFSMASGVSMLLREVDPSIWTAGTVNAALTEGVGTKLIPTLTASVAGFTATLLQVTGADGTKHDGLTLAWTAPPINVTRTEFQYRVSGATAWNTIPPVGRDIIGVNISPLLSSTAYEVQARHVMTNNVYGPWVALSPITITTGSFGNVTVTAINTAATTATWGNVSSKPTEITDGRISAGLAPTTGVIAQPIPVAIRNSSNLLGYAAGGTFTGELTADTTSTHVASSITGQGSLATLSSVAYGSANVSGFGGLAAKSSILLDNDVTDGVTYKLYAATEKTKLTGIATGATVGGIFNSNIYRNDTTTLVNDANAITSLGVASAITGQGALATKATVTYGTADVTGFGSIAGQSSLAYGGSYLTGFAALAAKAKISLGDTYIYRADGATSLTDALAVTSLGVASSVTGQGALATLGSVAYGSANVSGFGTIAAQSSLAYGGSYLTGFAALAAKAKISLGDTFIFKGDGVTSLTDTLAVTSLGTAAGFTGQGTLATKNSVLLDSDITNGTTYKLYAATEQSKLGGIASGATVGGGFNVNVYRNDGTTVVNDASAITSLGVASSVTGQGALATLGSVAYGSANVTGFGALAAKSTATYGTGDVTGFGVLASKAKVSLGDGFTFRADGITALSDANTITSLGTAAGFTGQGSFASLNSAAYGSSYLTGFGALAAKSTATYGTGDVTGFAALAAQAKITLGGGYVFKNDGVTSLTDALAVTSLGVAASVTGQGTLATKNSVLLDSDITNGTTYKLYAATEQTKLGGIASGATVGGIFNSNIYRNDGTTVVNDASAITSLGIAASVTGQGALATLSAVDMATTQIVNKSLANVDSTANTKLVGISTGADVTANVLPAMVGNLAFAISADYYGTITTTLPFTRQFSAKQGTTDVSGTTNWVLGGGYDVLGLTVDNTLNSATRGQVTVGAKQITNNTVNSTGNGTATLTATFPNGAVIAQTLTFTKTNSTTPPSGGGTSSTSASINTATIPASSTSAAVSAEVIVKSDATGKLKFSINATFYGSGTTHTAKSLFFNWAYATTTGGALTDVFSDTVPANTSDTWDSVNGWAGNGSVFLALTQFTMPAANTAYYFKLKGRYNIAGETSLNITANVQQV